jgi:HAMP domain-containing protein
MALLLDAPAASVGAEAPIPDADSPALRAALAGSRPLAASAIPTSRGPRALLVSPLSDWRGRSGVFAAFTFQLDDDPWLGLLRPVKPRPGLTASLLDTQGRSLAALQPPDGPVARPDDIVAAALLRATPCGRRASRATSPEALVAARRQFAWLVPIALALALAFGLGAARSITQPLAALDEAAGRIARGDLEAPVPDLGEDEVGRLGRSLDEMRGALRHSLAEVVQARDQLEERVRERTAELRELYRQLKEHDEARGRLLQKVISAQEEERRRMARELHDETCQTLTALVLAIDAAAARAEAGAPSPRADVKALATRALDGVHALIFDLRPSVLDDLGLLPAVRWLGARHLESRGVTCAASCRAARCRPS